VFQLTKQHESGVGLGSPGKKLRDIDQYFCE
jgi:hypothetical protein